MHMNCKHEVWGYKSVTLQNSLRSPNKHEAFSIDIRCKMLIEHISEKVTKLITTRRPTDF